MTAPAMGLRGGRCTSIVLCGFLLSAGCAYVEALRLVRVDLPGGVILGESVRLNCSFDLESDQLYSVKWYKANREFYRYIPSETPPSQTYFLPGVYVDTKQSNMNTLVLSKTDLSSEDVYKCEVSADAPSFQTIRAEKELKIYVLPKKGPKIVGVRPQYDIGDIVNVTCHAGLSKPAGRLEWFINGEHPSAEDDASEEIYPVAHHQGLMRSSLGLTFRVARRHFDHSGAMKLKCIVTVSESFSLSSEKIVVGTNTNNYPKELPDDGPVIYGGQAHCHVSDIMNVTCTYIRQDRPVTLSWLLNDEEVPPEYLVHYQPEKLDMGRYRTALGLSFVVRPSHFRNKQLQLKCTAEVDGPQRPHVVHHVHHDGAPGSRQSHLDAQRGSHDAKKGHKQRAGTANNKDLANHQVTPLLSMYDNNNLSQYSANLATTACSPLSKLLLFLPPLAAALLHTTASQSSWRLFALP